MKRIKSKAKGKVRKPVSNQDYEAVPFVTDFQWLDQEESKTLGADVVLAIAQELIRRENTMEQIQQVSISAWELNARLQGLRKS